MHNNKAISVVLSEYVLENANLKVIIQEQEMLINDLQKQLEEAEERGEEAEDDLS